MLKTEPICELARHEDGELVTIVAVAEEGKIVVLPNKAKVTGAMLVNGPDTEHQIHAMGRGRIDALLVHGRSVLVRGWVNDCSDGVRRLAVESAAVVGSDGFNVPHVGSGHVCALCEYHVAHSH